MSQVPSEFRPDQLAPHSVEAEEAVLGSILINADALFEVMGFLKAEDFFIVRHAWIWEALTALHERRDPIDYLTVVNELEQVGKLAEVGGAAYILSLVNKTPTALNVEGYGRIVERMALRRRLIEAAQKIAQVAHSDETDIDEVVSRAERAVFEVTEQRLARDLVPIKDAVSEYFDHVHYLTRHQEEVMGVPTGFIDLDRLLGGMQKSDLLIVAARPGMGKTSLLNSAVMHAARSHQRVAVFSLEMSNEQLVQRFVSAETNIPSNKLREGRLDEKDWDVFVKATERIGDLGIFLDDTPALSTHDLRTKARRLHLEFGLDLVVIDYLQLMTTPYRSENRVQEISYISRSLKQLARELNVPVFAAAQLSRAVEQRTDKRPVLSDLRESGCLSGDTRVYLPDVGRYMPISDLEGQRDFQVLCLNPHIYKLEPATASNVFRTGTKPLFRLTTQLGRTVRATPNHKFLTMEGWFRLDQLAPGDRIALPRRIIHDLPRSMSDEELALLGHLIGDGCTLPTHAVQYTTSQSDLAEQVADLARYVFGNEIEPRIHRERGWYQVYLSATRKLTHGVHNPVRTWLESLGIWGLRSHEKYVPDRVFAQSPEAIAVFVRHLWATDGCVNFSDKRHPIAYYASSSRRLARDVQSLLLHFGINARLKSVTQHHKGRDQYHVIVTGNESLSLFVNQIGAAGHYKQRSLAEIAGYLNSRRANTNRDVIPKTIWRGLVTPAMQVQGLTGREMQARLGNSYCGTGLYKQNISRERASRLAEVVQSEEIANLARSDVYWDKIVSIEPDGTTDVYDLTVPGPSNFVADNFIVHNSIEQDSDVVMFIYRDIYYNPDSPDGNRAEVHIAKHRNGPTGIIDLVFIPEITQFQNAARAEIDLDRI